jgi:phage shock protein C
VYRSRRDKVFAGVCGGLAEHFGISSTWLRVGFILGAVLTSFSLVPILYLVCLIVMPLEPQGYGHTSAGTANANSYHDDRSQKRDANRGPRFRDRHEAFDYLHQQFDRIEQKVRRMEDHVTSREYVLRRKFEEL